MGLRAHLLHSTTASPMTSSVASKPSADNSQSRRGTSSPTSHTTEEGGPAREQVPGVLLAPGPECFPRGPREAAGTGARPGGDSGHLRSGPAAPSEDRGPLGQALYLSIRAER